MIDSSLSSAGRGLHVPLGDRLRKPAETIDLYTAAPVGEEEAPKALIPIGGDIRVGGSYRMDSPLHIIGFVSVDAPRGEVKVEPGEFTAWHDELDEQIEATLGTEAGDIVRMTLGTAPRSPELALRIAERLASTQPVAAVVDNQIFSVASPARPILGKRSDPDAPLAPTSPPERPATRRRLFESPNS